MFALAGKLTNLRRYGSKRRPCRNAWVMGTLKRSQCGLVEIFPTNDHDMLQAYASWQDYSRDLRVYMQR